MAVVSQAIRKMNGSRPTGLQCIGAWCGAAARAAAERSPPPPDPRPGPFRGAETREPGQDEPAITLPYLYCCDDTRKGSLAWSRPARNTPAASYPVSSRVLRRWIGFLTPLKLGSFLDVAESGAPDGNEVDPPLTVEVLLQRSGIVRLRQCQQEKNPCLLRTQVISEHAADPL
jgi:hypothetical protein